MLIPLVNIVHESRPEYETITSPPNEITATPVQLVKGYDEMADRSFEEHEI